MNPLNSKSIYALSQYPRTVLVEASLDVAVQTESIFTRLYPEQARAAADYADAIRNADGKPISAIAGMPISIKDLLDVAGEPTTAGSIVLKNATPAKTDAPVVSRLRQAGAAIIGKTNMTEFAFSGVGLNPHYGTPVNPRDQLVARIPGGSSSGTAVSVATGLCIAGIGSDTGGSIRIPAALCGLVGFKPTASRMQNNGCIPLSTTLDTICAMTHSVKDVLLIDSIIANDALKLSHLPIERLRLAVPQTLVLDDMDAHVAATFHKTLSILSEAGAQIHEVPMSILPEYRNFGMFSAAEAYAWHRQLLREHEAEYDPRVARRIALGANISAADYLDMHAARKRWITKMEEEFIGFDAILMPTVPIVAPAIATLEQSDEAFFAANSLLLRNTSSINILNGCAISVPCNEPGTLPVGLSINGLAHTDSWTMSVAHTIECCLGQRVGNVE